MTVVTDDEKNNTQRFTPYQSTIDLIRNKRDNGSVMRLAIRIQPVWQRHCTLIYQQGLCTVLYTLQQFYTSEQSEHQKSCDNSQCKHHTGNETMKSK